MFLVTDLAGQSVKSKTLGDLVRLMTIENMSLEGAKVYHYGKQFAIDLTTVEPQNPPEPLLLWTARLPLRMRPAVKTTHEGRFSDAAKDYHAYKDRLVSMCLERGFSNAWDMYSIRIVGLMALPKDCFKPDGTLRKKGLLMAGSSYRVVPDMDNSIKPIADALIPRNDAGVIHMEGDKFYNVDRSDAMIVQIGYYPNR